MTDKFASMTLFNLDQPGYVDHVVRDESDNQWDEMTQLTPAPSTEAWDRLRSSRFAPSNAYWSHLFVTNNRGLVIPHAASQLLGSGAFTVEMWIRKTTRSNIARYIIGKGTATTGWRLRVSTTDQLVFSSGAGDIATTAANVIIESKWHHIAVVRTSTAIGGLKIYLDGVLAATSTAVSGTYTETDGLIIGNIPGNPLGNEFTGNITDVRISTEAVYTSAFAVPTAPLTSLASTVELVSMLGAAQPLTKYQTYDYQYRYARVSVGPFAETDEVGGSALFESTNHPIIITDSVGTNTSLRLGTSPFTIEAWVYLNTWANSVVCTKGANSAGWILAMQSNGFTFYDNTAANSYSTTTVNNASTYSRWTHVAIVRAGTGTNQTFMYVNGIKVLTFTCSSNFNQTDPFIIGKAGTAPGVTGLAGYFAGYISNVRISKVARYTDDFTPDTILTSDVDTSYLSLKSWKPVKYGLVDMTNVSKLSVAQYTSKHHAGPLSTAGNALYNTNGDAAYIKTNNTTTIVIGSNNFSFEAFVKVRNASFNDGYYIFDGRAAIADLSLAVKTNNVAAVEVWVGPTTWLVSSTRLVDTDKWYHVAVQRVNGYMALYIDGVQEALVPNNQVLVGFDPKIGSSTLYTTRGWYGYISNVRFVVDSAAYSADPYIDSVVSETNFEISATADYSGKVWTAVGNAAVSKLQKHSQTQSMYFDGSGDYLTTPQSSDFDFYNSDFTIEMWVYPTSVTGGRVLIEKRANSTVYGPFSVGIYNGTAYCHLSSTGSSWDIALQAGFGTVPANAWSHIVLCRSGSTFFGFVNGVKTTIATSSLSLYVNSSITVLGGETDVSWFRGYIDDLRVTKGIARYTDDFTVPASTINQNANSFDVPVSQLRAIPNTKLLAFTDSAQVDFSGGNTSNFLVYNGTDGGLAVSMMPRSPFVTSHDDYHLDAHGDSYSSTVYTSTPASLFRNGGNDLSFLTGGGTPWVLECWFWANGFSTAGVAAYEILSTTDAAAAANIGLRIAYNQRSGTVSGGGLDVYFNSAVTPSATPTNPVRLNAWNHIAIVYDTRHTASMHIYVNGLRTAYATPALAQRATDDGTVFQSLRFNGALVGGLYITKRNDHFAGTSLNPPSTYPIPTTRWTKDADTQVLITGIGPMTAQCPVLPSAYLCDAFVSTKVKKYGTGSIKLRQLNATGVSRLEIFDTAFSFNFAAQLDYNDFTFEMWSNWDSSTTGVTTPAGNVLWSIDALKLYADASGTGVYVLANGATDYIRTAVPIAKAPAFDHICLVRKSGNFVLYINGVVAGTAACDFTKEHTPARSWYPSSGLIRVGCDNSTTRSTAWSGYVQGVRLTEGVRYKTGLINSTLTMCDATLTTPTPVLADLAQGISYGTPRLAFASMVPYSTKYATDPHLANVVCNIEPLNDAVVDTTGINIVRGSNRYGPFITDSSYGSDNLNAYWFPGSIYSYMWMADSTNWDWSATTGVTVEAWVKWDGTVPGGTQCTLWGQNLSTSTSMRLVIQPLGVLKFYTGSDTRISAASTINMPVNRWTHLALVKNGTTYTLYVNGNSGVTYTDAVALANIAYPYQIGGEEENAVTVFRGFMSNFRITKAARYTAAFTPPARG